MTDGNDKVFRALAHRDRRNMLDIIRDRPGIPIGELAANFDCTRVAVHKHVRVLEEADLVVSEKLGRVRRLYFNLVPIQAIYERWTDDYSAAWAAGLTRFARGVENRKGQDDRKRKSGF